MSRHAALRRPCPCPHRSLCSLASQAPRRGRKVPAPREPAGRVGPHPGPGPRIGPDHRRELRTRPCTSRALTLRGFKLFASATTLRFEPGITCVVGPNGSGKSNVVDALSWVMGEQGAKSLRGGKMEDVIFVGTAGRPPLGRAEVSLTIDNTDGALPIDYTEVTITRTMFRGGGSEYAINGTACRLLDVQELLSDSGHRPRDARHRRAGPARHGPACHARGAPRVHRGGGRASSSTAERKEQRAPQARDDGGQPHPRPGPHRGDPPPARARSDARRRSPAGPPSSRPRRATHGCASSPTTSCSSPPVLEQEVADETALLERRTAVEDALAGVRARVGDVERRTAEAAPELARAQERFVRLHSLRDRMESTGSVAAERVRLLSQDEEHETTTGRDPEELTGAGRSGPRGRGDPVGGGDPHDRRARRRRGGSRGGRGRLRGEQDRLARLARAVADRREGLARLAGQVGARRSRIEAGEAEIGRLRTTVEAARRRAAEAEQEFSRLEGSVAVEEEGEEGLDDAYEAAAAHLAAAEAEVERLVTEERDAERDRSSATARLEALEMSLRRKDGAASLLATANADHAIVGSVATLLHVTGGHEAAVAAALGWASEALAVPTAHHAARAIAALRASDGGRAALLVEATASPGDPARPGPRSRVLGCGRVTSSRRRMPCVPPSSSCSNGWPSCRQRRTPWHWSPGRPE